MASLLSYERFLNTYHFNALFRRRNPRLVRRCVLSHGEGRATTVFEGIHTVTSSLSHPHCDAIEQAQDFLLRVRDANLAPFRYLIYVPRVSQTGFQRNTFCFIKQLLNFLLSLTKERTRSLVTPSPKIKITQKTILSKCSHFITLWPGVPLVRLHLLRVRQRFSAVSAFAARLPQAAGRLLQVQALQQVGTYTPRVCLP
jgi:hypothetical protein